MIKHSPFALEYRFEAMIPMEVEIPSYGCKNYDPKVNGELLNASLYLVDERQDEAQLHISAHQSMVTH